MFKSYRFYYYPSLFFINDHTEESKYSGLNTFRYLLLSFNIRAAQKSRTPVLALSIIFFGVGFSFNSHIKK